MPKTIPNKSLEFTVNVHRTPETAEEYDELARKGGRAEWEGACVDNAVDYCLRHMWNSKFRAAMAKAIEAETKVKRRSFKEGDKVTSESEASYVEWICRGASTPTGEVNEKGEEIKENKLDPVDRSSFGELAQTVADSIPFTVAPAPRTATPSKELLRFAQEMVNAIEAGQGTFEGTKDNMEANNPGLTIPVEEDGTISVDSFAYAAKFQQSRVLREAALGAVA